jgi:transcriptional regulator with XRE-family HTH domain
MDKSNIKAICGEVFKDLRTQKGISQESLAFEAGLDRSYISKLETGVYQPSITTLFAIAQVLEVDPSAIVKKMYDIYLES